MQRRSRLGSGSGRVMSYVYGTRQHPLTQHIGSSHGRIALWLTESQAIDLAHLYGLDDIGAQEIMEAVEAAYPEEEQ